MAGLVPAMTWRVSSSGRASAREGDPFIRAELMDSLPLRCASAGNDTHDENPSKYCQHLFCPVASPHPSSRLARGTEDTGVEWKSALDRLSCEPRLEPLNPRRRRHFEPHAGTTPIRLWTAGLDRAKEPPRGDSQSHCVRDDAFHIGASAPNVWTPKALPTHGSRF